ncbi:unnamed protein product [Spirodela intermedia]|uniref:Uncharacterized protein n=1 Tax=Spirodela intermedia TaxID=51605 RepID=A0A7I8LBX8_SPIIN|nr:unnamed protein product [Spirodela intermedia]
MESSATKFSGSYGGDSADGESWKLENPFSFKVLQIFTGVGVGCGVGIGVGKPIYLGAIPAFQQVLSATRGAMDVFSGAGRHVNSNLRRFGVKNIEAGIGCGVGIGHGFGVGITLKPGVVHKLQSFVGVVIGKILTKFGTIPGLPALQASITGSEQKSTDTLSPGFNGNPGTSIGNVLQFTTEPIKIPSSIQESERSSSLNLFRGSQELKAGSSEMTSETRTERVINSFLQSPIFKEEEQAEIDELVRKLRSENNILQMLLKHQKTIDELIEENEKLRQILVEDLKVSPEKFSRGHGNNSELIERRRSRRRWTR